MNRPLSEKDAIHRVRELQTAQAEFDHARTTTPETLLNSHPVTVSSNENENSTYTTESARRKKYLKDYAEYIPLCSALAIDPDSSDTTGKTALQQAMERPYMIQGIREIRSTVIRDIASKKRLPLTIKKVVRDATWAVDKRETDYTRDNVKLAMSEGNYDWHATRFIARIVIGGRREDADWTVDEDTEGLCWKAVRLLRWMICQFQGTAKGDENASSWVTIINGL